MATTKQHHAGKNLTGTLRRECRHCGRTYTPAPKAPDYDLSVRRQALKLYVDGTLYVAWSLISHMAKARGLTAHVIAKKEVGALVQKYLEKQNLGDITFSVLEEEVRRERYAGCVPVVPSREPEKMFVYYEVLAEVEAEPAIPEETAVAA